MKCSVSFLDKNMNNNVKEKHLEFDINSWRELSVDRAGELFLRVIDDFKEGKITLDKFSKMGFNVFHGVAKKYQDSKLFQASLLASELNFAVRSPAVYKNIPDY